MKVKCATCGKILGHKSYQFETGNWVATGKFPTLNFCGKECGSKFYRGFTPAFQIRAKLPP